MTLERFPWNCAGKGKNGGIGFRCYAGQGKKQGLSQRWGPCTQAPSVILIVNGLLLEEGKEYIIDK